jgi:hypothetical protein
VTVPLTTDGPIFREADQPWRWRGVSAFSLAARHAAGEDIGPFLAAYAGWNVLRVWDYVTWPGEGWESIGAEAWIRFLVDVGARGWRVSLTLLTDDDPGRIEPARRLVQALAARRADLPGLMLEIGNEPTTHKAIDTRALEAVCRASGSLFASGDYEESARAFGTHLLYHSSRDGEWMRKGGHDALEYYRGGGPGTPQDPAHRCPCVADEPIRPDQAGFNTRDFLAYYGTCGQMAAGATIHTDTGKLALLPTDNERACIAAALAGLAAFPADTPLGLASYRRIDPDPTAMRSYVIGETLVRVRPTTPSAPEPGWTSLDTDGILWTRKAAA